MAMQGLGDNVKGRVEAVGQQTQDVMKVYFNTTRQFYTVVFDNAQTLAHAEYRAAKGLVDATASHLDEARSGGVEQFAFVPVKLWPLGREHLFDAYEEAREHFVKTREELLDVVREGYRSVWGLIRNYEAQSEQSRKTTSGAVNRTRPAQSSAPADAQAVTEDMEKTTSQKTQGQESKSSGAAKASPQASSKPAVRGRRKTATTARKKTATTAKQPAANAKRSSGGQDESGAS